jgi:hypothetical protein
VGVEEQPEPIRLVSRFASQRHQESADWAARIRATVR